MDIYRQGLILTRLSIINHVITLMPCYTEQGTRGNLSSGSLFTPPSLPPPPHTFSHVLLKLAGCSMSAL